MIKQEFIGIPDMIIYRKIKAEIIVCSGGAYFNILLYLSQIFELTLLTFITLESRH